MTNQRSEKQKKKVFIVEDLLRCVQKRLNQA